MNRFKLHIFFRNTIDIILCSHWFIKRHRSIYPIANYFSFITWLRCYSEWLDSKKGKVKLKEGHHDLFTLHFCLRLWMGDTFEYDGHQPMPQGQANAQPKPQHLFATVVERRTQTSKAPLFFFFSVLSKGKFVFFIYIIKFLHILFEVSQF